MTQEKRPVGRPRTTVNDLPSNWKQIMTDCGQEGGSAVEARCLLGISTSAWETLLADSEDFRETENTRKALCEIWWERQGRRMSQDGVGSAAVWVFNMKNRFGWRDKQEIDHSSTDGSMSPKQGIDLSNLSNEELQVLHKIAKASNAKS